MFDAPSLVKELERKLRAAGTRQRAVSEKAYLKSPLEHFGVTVPDLRKIVRPFVRAHGDLTRANVVALVTALWDEPIHERRSTAIELLTCYADRLVVADLKLVERFVREGRSWAYVDALAAFIAGAIVERFPEANKTLDRWAKDPDFWVRRTALLALLLPLRAGRGDFERFARYADTMLEEKEFFIRKAIGWVLREVSKKRPELVAAWLRPRVARASGVTLREAKKYLPPGALDDPRGRVNDRP